MSDADEQVTAEPRWLNRLKKTSLYAVAALAGGVAGGPNQFRRHDWKEL